MLKIVALIASLACTQAVLLVSKDPDCARMRVGADCAVHYHFVNAGNDTVTNVRMDDDWGMNLKGMVEIVKGSTSARFASIEPHGHAFHSFIFRPNSVENGDKLFHLTAKSAAVHYELNGEIRLVYSSSIVNDTRAEHRHFVMSNNLYDKLVGSKLQYWLVFASLVSAPTLLSLFFHFKTDKQFPMKKTQ